MIRVNIHEAKTHLSRYVRRVRKGETVLLCVRNEPVAEIRPLPAKLEGPRPIGLAKGQVVIPKQFFDPLPDADLDAWQGKIE
jgi:prevent-host-death family protein